MAIRGNDGVVGAVAFHQPFHGGEIALGSSKHERGAKVVPARPTEFALVDQGSPAVDESAVFEEKGHDFFLFGAYGGEEGSVAGVQMGDAGDVGVDKGGVEEEFDEVPVATVDGGEVGEEELVCGIEGVVDGWVVGGADEEGGIGGGGVGAGNVVGAVGGGVEEGEFGEGGVDDVENGIVSRDVARERRGWWDGSA